MQAYSELKNLFKNNYTTFLKNLLSASYKIKLSYDMNFCRKIESKKYYIELSSTVRDIFNYSNKKIIEQFLFNLDNNKSTKLSVSCTEESQNVLFKSNFPGNDKLHFRFVKNLKNDKETNLEIWFENILINSLKIEDFNITKLYYDDVFGKPKFSPDGKKIIFITETDTSKLYKNYFNIKNESEDAEDGEKATDNIEKNLSKFEYKQDFGEGLKDKCTPKIFIYDIEKNKFFNLKLENYANIFPSSPMFDYNSQDIIFCGYDFPDFKLGLIYCLKRKSSIYLVKDPILEEINPNAKNKKKNKSETEPTNKLINLSTAEYTNLYPSFSPNFKYLIWFANENATPHMNGLKLYSIDWQNKKRLDETSTNNEEYSTLQSRLTIDKIKKDNPYFNGIYSYEDTISQSNFLNDDLFVFTSQHRNTDCVYLYNFTKNALTKLPSQVNSQKVISIKKEENLIFTLCSDVKILPHINTIALDLEEYNNLKYEEEKLENGLIYQKNITSSEKVFNTVQINNGEFFNTLIKNEILLNNNKDMIKYMDNVLNNIQVDDLHLADTYGHFIYLKNRTILNEIRDENWKSPIVYIIHGGPNSVFDKMFFMVQLIFLAHGYSVLVVNYPGSTGYGQDYLSSLSGNIGKLDVQSCGEFLNSFIGMSEYKNMIDSNNVMLYGGSHGGFLSCWLSSHEKYCKMFSASAIRNPVTDLTSMMATTDIPDWVVGQATDEDVTNNYPPSKELYDKLHDASPIYNVKNCITPALFCLGKIDKRVNWFNGLYFYQALRKTKCETKLLVYPEDGHPLSSFETEVDCLFNICYWFEKHLKL